MRFLHSSDPEVKMELGVESGITRRIDIANLGVT